MLAGPAGGEGVLRQSEAAMAGILDDLDVAERAALISVLGYTGHSINKFSVISPTLRKTVISPTLWKTVMNTFAKPY